MISRELKQQLIVLVHGYFKNASDMAWLQSGLEKHGYTVKSTNLPTTFGSLQECVDSLKLQIQSLIKTFKIVHFVGHSFGGLIIQEYLMQNILTNLGNCVYIATPSKGTRMADILVKLPFVKSIFKPIQFLRTKESTKNQISLKRKLGVIAGSKNNLIFGKCFLSAQSDGRVEIESTKIGEMDDFIVLPYGHKEIHFAEDTLKEVVTFLETGIFENLEK